MKSYILITAIFLLSSCCKAIIETKPLFTNTTSSSVELRLFERGTFIAVKIPANTTEVAFYGIPYGASPTQDSIQVFADNKYLHTHYSKFIKTAPVDSGRIVRFDKLKNLFNESSYRKTVEELSCNGSSTTYEYIF